LSESALTDAEIIGHCQSGALIDDVDRFELDDDDPSSLVHRCVALHNSGQLDLLSLTESAQFGALSLHQFFVVQHFFDQAIPKLDTTAAKLTAAVTILVTKGGNDLASNAPNEAFRAWCAAEPSRAHAIVADAQRGDPTSIKFVTFALRALEDVALARKFVADYTDERRLSGLFVLGRIPTADAGEARDTLEILLPHVHAGQEDMTRCNAVLSAFELVKLHPGLAGTFVPRLIGAAVVSPGPTLLYNLAQILWNQGALIDRPSLAKALDALKATDPSLGGIVHMLDLTLKAAIQGPNADLAFDYLTDVLGREDGGFALDQFKSFTHAVATGDRDRQFRLVVRWLLTGNSDLGRAVSALFEPGDRSKPFDATTAGMGLTDTQQIFLCYKALGWLFTNEAVAASIMVAALRGCATREAEIIGDLLFDPLLFNYGGRAREYLKTIKKGDPAYGQVRKALKSCDAFYKGLDIGKPIKELNPSEYQRSVERTHVQDMMRKAHKEAEKHSVLINLVHRSTLLYGRRSVTYVRDPDNKRRAVSMDMHSFGTSIELPRSEIIDPIGLSVMLLTFRSAQPR
jgi:hypothetical protein